MDSVLFLAVLQVVCILYGFFLRVLHQSGVAAKGICDDDFFLLFHMLTPDQFSTGIGKDDCLFAVKMVEWQKEQWKFYIRETYYV